MALSLDGTTGISASGNIVGNNVIASGTLTAGTFSPSVLSASGNITGGNLITAGLITASGNITGGNVLGGANVNATTHTGTTVSVTGNVTSGNILTGGLISATGNITGGNVLGGANVNATTHTGTTVSVTGAITGGAITGSSLNITTGTANVGSITNANANGVGNIGNSTVYFNTVFAKATSAQYADVAEKYLADQDYPTGTVLVFGGQQEVTTSVSSYDARIAGTVSDKPSYIMNAGLTGECVTTVALLGRVPCRVIGPVAKGDLLTSSDLTGVAMTMDKDRYQPGCVLGKALENYADSQQVGCIEIVVGRL